jgi:hypothetical protein
MSTGLRPEGQVPSGKSSTSPYPPLSPEKDSGTQLPTAAGHLIASRRDGQA